MKHSSVVSAAIFIAAILLMLVQLWFHPWTDPVFAKIMITAAALLTISLVMSFVKKELKDIKRLKDGGDLDN